MCAPTISQTLGSDCISIPGVSQPPPLPSFPGFQMYVACNKLTVLSLCLIGCAVISVLCCGCRFFCLYCCREEKEDYIAINESTAAPLLSSINSSSSISREELIAELAQAKKRHEKLSEQLITAQRDLLDVRDSLFIQQPPKQHPTHDWAKARNE